MLLDEIFISIQTRFPQNCSTKCIFATTQLFVSLILLWFLRLYTMNKMNLLIFATMYYNTQYNLWDNMLAFKYTNKFKNNNTNL